MSHQKLVLKDFGLEEGPVEAYCRYWVEDDKGNIVAYFYGRKLAQEFVTWANDVRETVR